MKLASVENHARRHVDEIAIRVVTECHLIILDLEIVISREIPAYTQADRTLGSVGLFNSSCGWRGITRKKGTGANLAICQIRGEFIDAITCADIHRIYLEG